MPPPRFIHNIASLGLVHAANAAVTLITIPLLTRSFGAEGWGQIVFVSMVVNYLIWISNWSFYLSGTKKISANRNDLAKIEIIYNTTMYAQWAITLIAILFLAILVATIPFFKEQATLYMLAAGLLISNALQPLWFLNGMEMVRESAMIQLIAKLLALPVILLLITDRNDLYIFFLVNAFAGVATGLGCIYWIYQKYNLSFISVRSINVIRELKDGFSLFLSTVWANLCSSIIPMALGMLSGPSQLGYYNLADRIRGASIQLIHPVTHALFPRMCHLFNSDSTKAWKLLRMSGLVILSIVFISSTIIYFFAKDIIVALAGPEFESSVQVVKILAITVPTITASEFLMYQFLIPTGQSALQNKSRFYPFLLGMALVHPTVSMSGAIGAAWLSLCIEVFTLLVIIIGTRATNCRNKSTATDTL